MNRSRSSGILCHPTSLPGPYGLGDLGASAEAFIDFLARAGQSLWQILPLGPTGYGHSPYSSFSAFAGNPLLISLEKLVEVGDLLPEELPPASSDQHQADYPLAERVRTDLLQKAARRFFSAAGERRERYRDFTCEQASWLSDYAIFQALRGEFGQIPWNNWPAELVRRDPEALRDWSETLDDQIRLHSYAQFVFFEQWFAIKNYANNQGVGILGDLPIFVAYDSCDVWVDQHLYLLDAEGRPSVVAGVPPDYFSATGQRWGNPLYDWEAMTEDNFAWWRARLGWNLQLTDLVRIDHFRGLEACWQIPVADPTAVNGRWVSSPGRELLTALAEEFGALPVVAEDLGVITPEVEALRDSFELPGMKILQFAFDSGPDNPYLPHNHTRNSVVYTGTHDNNTTLGWWQALTAEAQEQVCAYLGHPCQEMPWDLIRTAQASVARICILPLQDILGLAAQGRMNRPGEAGGNWGWRFAPQDLDDALAQRLRNLTHRYGRAAGENR